MQTLFLEKGTSRRLIAVFLGWAMDHRPFATLHRPGYDLVLLWDYSEPDFDYSQWSHYDEIVVVGWSMGVYFCAQLPEALERRVTRRIAVNGTLTPMDNRTGIPEVIFMGTLKGMDSRNLEKFYFRVCGSREAYSKFSENHPQRDINRLRNELEAMSALPPLTGRFDLAVISSRDGIFPPENQRRAWASCPVVEVEGAHLPDFQQLLDRFVVDKDMVMQRFSCGSATYESEAVVQEELVRRMDEELGDIALGDVLEVGCGTGLLSRRIAARSPRSFEMWDVCQVEPFSGARVRRVDAETAIKDVPAAALDLIATASTIQWFNSPVAFMDAAATALRPGGILAVGTYAKGNLSEITDLIPASLPLMSEQEWLAVIPDSLEIVATESWSRTLNFDSPLDAFRHLKLTGVNSLGRTAGIMPSLRGIMSRYASGPGGKWTLTYRPLMLILKKKENETPS